MPSPISATFGAFLNSLACTGSEQTSQSLRAARDYIFFIFLFASHTLLIYVYKRHKSCGNNDIFWPPKAGEILAEGMKNILKRKVSG